MSFHISRKLFKSCSVVLFLFAASCSSMSREVFQDFHQGDPSIKVTARFGEPRSFEPSKVVAGASAWQYSQRGEQCTFTIQNDAIALIECGDMVGYVNPAAAFFKGFGDGLKNSRGVSCHSNTVGTNTYTDCN